MSIRRFTQILPTLVSVALGVFGLGFLVLVLFTKTCSDERPIADEKVGTYGKTLAEAKQEVAEGDDDSALEELRDARHRFEVSSQVQLAEMATQVESRGRIPTIPIERIETLRKDYWLLVELRRLVLESTDETFEDALNQYESQVDTMREQFARIDRGQLP